MRPARGLWAVAVALVAALFGTWLLGWSTNLDPIGAVLGEPARVEVPDLAGLAEPRAVADIESAGLVAELERSLSLTAPRGAVVSQEPSPGTVLDEGSTVEVLVSSGIARVEMPDAVGQPVSGVTPALDEAAVEYTVETVASEEVAAGIVISQDPPAGVRVTAADDVVFVVSSGPDPRPVPMVAGLSAEGGAYALGLAGFDVEVELREDEAVRAGVAIGTEPEAGTVAERDSRTLLVVSSGPPAQPLPDVRGDSLGEATARLEAIGVVPNVVGGGASGGTVSTTEPAASTPVRRGEVVKVVLRGG
ncbi:MAG: PASTA domain-containing protein [Microthrixaceae bacterium]|nr:PASTA domain-containing protein [Microthrixaceae bacterium]MCO5319094.1 PASTA domain-containing protein [Microthrixaceae bacterium]